MNATLRIRAITPIRVGRDELERRRRRYAELAPDEVSVHLDNLPSGADTPTRLETSDDIAASDTLVAREADRTDVAAFDAVLPDCVLDPGLDRLRSGQHPLPVLGITELSAPVVAATVGRFAAVTRNEVIGEELARRISLGGLADRFAGVEVLGLEIADVADDRRWNATLRRARTALEGRGVHAVLNGCSAVEVRDGARGWPVVLDPTRLALQVIGTAHRAGLLSGGRAADG